MEQALEIFGVLTGLLYLYLEIKQKSIMWIVGFITSLVYVFVFFQAKFYADMGLNIYYVLISVYGLIQWRKRAVEQKVVVSGSEEIRYTTLSPLFYVGLSVFFVILYLGMAQLLESFTDSPVPYGDALTTSLGIIATWMLAKRVIHHWIIWVFVNAFSVYLYLYRELYPTAFLYLCYCLLAVVGYINWKKKGVYYDHIE
ncbi:MAG: nicotinamide riboside transporter PnuC [Bacteroidales bacterium]